MAGERFKRTTFADLISEGALEIGDGYRAKNDELGGHGLIFLRAGHVTDTHIDFQGVERFHTHLEPRVRSKLAKPGDAVITTKGNSTGRTTFVSSSMPPFVYSPHLSYWRSLDTTRIEGGFLRYWCKGSEFAEQLAGMKASTDMAPYLSAGQALRLRVDLIEPQVTLQIVEPELAPEDEAAKFLRQHLPGPAAERESLAGLQAKIEAVSLFDVTHASLVRLEKLKHFLAELLNSKEPLDTARLMRWVRDGGLHYEAKLLRAVMENPERLAEIADHDLKALLLGALGELETNRLSGAPLNAIVSQLGDLESRQAVSLLAQLEGHAYQLQIPFFTAGGFSNLALSVERDGGGGRGRADDSAQGYNILFLLELEDFGRTRIDARLEGRNLRVIFYVEREDSIRLLTHEMSSLRETLLALGCREVLLSAWPLRAMPREQRPKFEALALGVPPDLQLLNVKV